MAKTYRKEPATQFSSSMDTPLYVAFRKALRAQNLSLRQGLTIAVNLYFAFVEAQLETSVELKSPSYPSFFKT